MPLPASAAAFGVVVAFGRQLREPHLLRPAALPAPLPTRFGGPGTSSLVEKPHYDAATQRVYLNATQYVEPVPPAVWAFPIGGYQPAQKWLKDRQGRTLTFDDSRHYQRLLAALAGTERLMREWDEGETAYLLSSQANARAVSNAIAEADRGDGQSFSSVDELRQHIGLDNE